MSASDGTDDRPALRIVEPYARKVPIGAARAAGAHLAVLVVVAAHADRRGRAWPSARTVAAHLDLTVGTVLEHLRALVAADLLVRLDAGGPRRSATYLVPWLAPVDNAGEAESSARPGRALRAVGPRAARGGAAQNKTMNKTMNKTAHTPPPHPWPCACPACLEALASMVAPPAGTGS